MIPKKQSGTHTWDIYVHYHLCPQCGFIIESRDDFEYRLGQYVKEIECGRCHHIFTESMSAAKHLGPFMGKPPKPEFDWSS